MNIKPTPVKVVTDGENLIKTHPSFVMVGFNRITCSPPGEKLFGSEIESQSMIRLSVVEAQEQWHLSQTWHHGGKHLIEVDLSPAQFAELLTSMNVGSGVCGTLRFRERDGQIPSALDENTLPEQIKADIKRDTQSLIDAAKAFGKQVNQIVGSSKLTKADKASLIDIAANLQMTLESNMPFVIDQYVEAVDKVTASAKAEVDAFVVGAATRLGFKTLQDIAKQAALTDQS